jgi:hypothetical protein
MVYLISCIYDNDIWAYDTSQALAKNRHIFESQLMNSRRAEHLSMAKESISRHHTGNFVCNMYIHIQ